MSELDELLRELVTSSISSSWRWSCSTAPARARYSRVRAVAPEIESASAMSAGESAVTEKARGGVGSKLTDQRLASRGARAATSAASTSP